MLALVAVSLATLHVRPSVAVPGERVVVGGNADGCPRGDVVKILSQAFPGHGFAGIGELDARVQAGGMFKTSGRIRGNARPGTYLITARCGGGNLGVSARLRVR